MPTAAKKSTKAIPPFKHPDDVVRTRMNSAHSNMLRALGNRPIDRSYQNEYRAFIEFCEKVGFNTDINNPYLYINRKSIDEYFERAVVRRPGKKSHIGRVSSALQWAYNSVEKESRKNEPFTVVSARTKGAVDQQDINIFSGVIDSGDKAGTDPHKGIKDIMPMSDKLKIMRCIHESRNDWGSLSTSFTWGNNAAVRGASSRKLVYADLNLTRGFGPEKEGDMSRVLLLILRRGRGIHKDNFTTDKQVGSWRHRHYIMCSQFTTALHVINDLRNNSTINFHHVEKSERAPWWDTPLVAFDEVDEESKAMKQVLVKSGVHSCKVTHHRTQAVQLAGSESLAPYQIATFTKHMLEKIHSAYMPELDKQACKVMADFGKDEPYVVDYARVKLPRDVSYYVNLLLPKYPVWLEEQKSRTGDKSTLANKFLYQILPYMVEVLLQGGIYFMKDFPNHPMSQHITVSSFSSWSVLLTIFTSFLNNFFLLIYLKE
jgi:hypothetical protein